MSKSAIKTKLNIQLNTVIANICYERNPIYIVTDWVPNVSTIATAYEIGEGSSFINLLPNKLLGKLLKVLGKAGDYSSNSVNNLFGNDAYDNIDNIEIIHREYTRIDLDDEDIEVLTDVYNTIAFVMNHVMSTIITRSILRSSDAKKETTNIFNTPYGTTCVLIKKEED